MTQYVVIGTSPTGDEEIAVGPFRVALKVEDAVDLLVYKGWEPHTIKLLHLHDIFGLPTQESGPS